MMEKTTLSDYIHSNYIPPTRHNTSGTIKYCKFLLIQASPLVLKEIILSDPLMGDCQPIRPNVLTSSFNLFSIFHYYIYMIFAITYTSTTIIYTILYSLTRRDASLFTPENGSPLGYLFSYNKKKFWAYSTGYCRVFGMSFLL